MSNWRLDSTALPCKVNAMEPNWAEENLKVIRTLMERSAMYRRALAPVMFSTGFLGVAGWQIGDRFGVEGYEPFLCLWFTVAAFAIGASLLIVRRQALSSSEPFWTSPTKRVTQAMIPPLVAGLLFSLIPLPANLGDAKYPDYHAVWILLYGCALNSAGQFISRGVRLLGWAFIVASLLIFCMELYSPLGTGPNGKPSVWFQPNALMGLTFGGFHLIAGIYLYFTEKSRNAQ